MAKSTLIYLPPFESRFILILLIQIQPVLHHQVELLFEGGAKEFLAVHFVGEEKIELHCFFAQKIFWLSKRIVNGISFFSKRFSLD